MLPSSLWSPCYLMLLARAGMACSFCSMGLPPACLKPTANTAHMPALPYPIIYLPAEAEMAYSCPHCGHTLGKHDTFSAAALAKADPALQPQQAQQGAAQQQQQQDSAAAGASGSGGPKWETSAKLDALMDILQKLRDKGAAGVWVCACCA